MIPQMRNNFNVMKRFRLNLKNSEEVMKYKKKQKKTKFLKTEERLII